MSRIKATAALAAALLTATVPVHAAGGYPSQPIRLIVPFAPGGGVDLNARLLGAKLTEYLGQSVIVENKPGAGTNIANAYVARANPDGYTLLITSAAIAINMSLYKQLSFDTLRDFAPVSLFSVSPNILVVNASLPVASVSELVAYSHEKKAGLTYASAGAGSTQHLVAELFKSRTGAQLLHVPFKGTGPLLSAVLAGDVDLTFANIAPVLPYVKSGKLRALATTGTTRSTLMPDLPTLKESGLEPVGVDVWVGVFAPAGTPDDVLHVLAGAIARAAAAPDVRKALADQGNEAVSDTPEAFKGYVRDEVAKWADIVRMSGASTD